MENTGEAQIKLKALLGKVAKSDQQAFKLLYDDTSGQLYGIMVRVLGHGAIADEALQEAYMRIWQKADSYDESLGQPLTWMSTVARNHALDIRRKRVLREDKEVDWLEESPEHQQDHKVAFTQKIEIADVLGLCLERLEPSARTCSVGAYIEGHSQQELSQQLESPLGTVKSWIRRGLLILRECLNEHD